MRRTRTGFRSFRLESSSGHRRHDGPPPRQRVGLRAHHHGLPKADLDDGNAGIGAVAPLYRTKDDRALATITVDDSHDRNPLEQEQEPGMEMNAGFGEPLSF